MEILPLSKIINLSLILENSAGVCVTTSIDISRVTFVRNSVSPTLVTSSNRYMSASMLTMMENASHIYIPDE